MFVVDPWKSVAHLLAPDRHRQESQRRIIEAVVALVRFFLYPIVKRQISPEQSCPRVGGRVAGRQAACFCQCLLTPVESVDDVVLITDMAGVFPCPAAELNSTQEQCKNEQNRENAEPKFTIPRRSSCAAQKRLRNHPPNTKTRNGFDSFEEFVFETVFRLVAVRLTDNQAVLTFQALEFDYGVNV